MDDLDFQPAKSEKEFQDNYKLHDLAEFLGKNLLTQWGIEFNNFGEDRRNEKLWECGTDKPDVIITYNKKSAFIDWKAKHSEKWIVNKRAVKSYESWQKKFNIPVIICFIVFDENNNFVERRFALLRKHKYNETAKVQWDKNRTIEFSDELPLFNKTNLIKYVFDNSR